MTVNTVNGKIYVGVHKNNSEQFDGYIGCGVNIHNSNTYKKSKTPFQFAVNKYGCESFKRTTLKEFSTLEEALMMESLIVNEEFLKRKDVYNVALGGGMPPDTTKVIFQYSLEGFFIKEWNSKKEASTFYNCSVSNIETALLFKTTSIEYLWSYEKTDKLNLTLYNIYSTKQSIYKYNDLGKYIETYLSITDAANCNNTTTSNIQRSIKGKYKVNNFYFSDKLNINFELPEKTSIKNKEIHQYSLSGEYINTFKSTKDVVSFLGIKSSSTLSTSIRLGRACGNFQ